ncbi:MAG: hypothetical protein ABSF92_08315 [Candidatus Acidiferrales bacterium]|jgi:hypothetical protein
MKRREFAKRAAAAAIVGSLPWNTQRAQEPSPSPKRENGPSSRSEELKRKALAQQEERVSALRAKPLPYGLEPAFVFSAKPRERRRRK